METIQQLGEIIDVEEYSKAGKTPPHGKVYRIRIDKNKYDVTVPTMTGRQLLELAGKTPIEQFRIYQKLRGGQSIVIDYNQTVDFRSPGIERFMTLPLDQTEG